ncbi:integrin alpha-9-like [Diadema setosum]|uniref:integrin alpha-9-like n=1 Tax=Diadema setosum TaxID=31175 RepID=UPI003B3A99EC
MLIVRNMTNTMAKLSDDECNRRRVCLNGSYPGTLRGSLRTPSISVVVVLVAFLTIYSRETFGCNIDTREPYATFNSDQHNQPGSYFGYSVLQHYNNFGWWVLIGAPRGTSSVYQSSAKNAGALWRCRQTSTDTKCQEVEINEPSGTNAASLLSEGIVENADNAWMGVTLTRQSNKQLAAVTVCGHRFGNDIALQQAVDFNDVLVDRYIQGLCYTLDPELEETQTRFNPCAGEDVFRSGIRANETRWQGWCQFGASATYTIEEDDNIDQTLVAGAVGSYDWTGTTFVQNTAQLPEMVVGDLSAWNKDYEYEDFYQYVGYSTTVGHFKALDSQEGAVGAPRAGGLVGRVYIYDLQDFTIYQVLGGEQMNTYFGGAVEAFDVDGDGLSDLLVGAPLYSIKGDEGRVYVYLNNGGTLELHQTLQGESYPGARFGHVVTSIGDLNKDGFTDVAIGAPYEAGGAVYIYQSNEEGIDEAYSQRILGSDAEPTVQSFGSSISGGFDFDANTYPDISVGAYANDSVYLYKTRPLLDLMVDVTLDPGLMDPDNPSCVDPVKGTCVEINVCFNYIGPSPAALPDSIEVIYDVAIDKIKLVEGLRPRFLMEQGDEMVSMVNKTKTIFKDQETCFNYTAYLQDTATDFLTPLPVDVTYILMDYDVEPPQRGDVPYRFPAGLAPVMKSYQCGRETEERQVMFVSDCGSDAVCETDIRLTGDVETEGGTANQIVVGGPGKLYINARIANVGEEAHQALFTVDHVTDMRYEGLEVKEVSCIDDSGQDVTTGCKAGQVLVTCEPTQIDLGSSRVTCYLGNPMNAYTANTLRLRFDIGGLIWQSGRTISIQMTASTSSKQTDEMMLDNSISFAYSLVIEADIGLYGMTTPESVFYSSNSSRYADTDSASTALTEALSMALLPDPTAPEFNDTYIGTPFSISYTLSNEGPGILPHPSLLTINIPWRMVDGGWLIYIKSISVTERMGSGSCNIADILRLQSNTLLEILQGSNSFPYAPEEDVTPLFEEQLSEQSMDCHRAKCVALTCHIDPLQIGYSLEIHISALQWEHTFITRKLGYVEILTEANVESLGNEHGQGENENPDRVQVPVTIFTDVAGKGTVPIWVIIISIIGGILLLILIILLLWKCGFFKRKNRKDWEKEAEQGGKQAPPMPVKPNALPSDNLDGTDLPMMKGLAASP